MPRGDRSGPQGQGPKTGRGRGNAVLKAEALHHRIKTVWEPAGVKAGDQAKVPAGVRAKAEVQARAKAGDLDILDRT